MKKLRQIAPLLLISFILLFPVAVKAATLNSSYEFKGGLYSSKFYVKSGNRVQVKTVPSKWPKEKFRINIYLEKQGAFGRWYSVNDSWNYSYKTDSTTQMKTNSSGDHRIYLRSSSLPNSQTYKGSLFIFYNY
ncbi:hypothetical protein [Listeria fleischmannii]|nr:hypothetical protein [Listeria fleischmannii]